MSALSSESDISALKSKVAAAVRMLTAEGLMDFNGHLSVRTPHDPQCILINPRHVSRNVLTGDDIVMVDLRGKPLDGGNPSPQATPADARMRVAKGVEPPSETPIHTSIYRQRPDAVSVAHIHPQIATAYDFGYTEDGRVPF